MRESLLDGRGKRMIHARFGPPEQLLSRGKLQLNPQPHVTAATSSPLEA
jgi:hypothetical protein